MKKTIFIFLFSLLFPVIPLFARIRIPIPVPAGGAGIVVIIIIIIINIAIRVAGSGGKGSYVRQANTLLNTEGKKMLLSAAVYISAADRIIKRSEKKLLKSLSSQEIYKIINSIRQNLSLEEEVDDSENNEDTPSEWICTWCGKTNEPTTEFCSKCNEPNRLSWLHK